MRNFHRGYKNETSSSFGRSGDRRNDRDNRYNQQDSYKRPDKGFNRSFSDRNTKPRRDYNDDQPSRSTYGQDDRDRNVGNRSFGGNNRTFQERNFRTPKPDRSSFRNQTPPRQRDRDSDSRFNRSIDARRPSPPPFRNRNDFPQPSIRSRPTRGPTNRRGPGNFGSSGSRILRRNDLRSSLISKRAAPVNRSKEYIKKIKQARLKLSESGAHSSTKNDDDDPQTPPKESKKADEHDEHDEDFLDVANDVTFDEDLNEMSGKTANKNEENGEPSKIENDDDEAANKSTAEDLNNSGASKSEERTRADRSEKSASKEKETLNAIDLNCIHCSTRCSSVSDFRHHLTRRHHQMAMKKVSIRVRSTLNRLRKIQRERQLEIEARLKNVEKIPSKYCQICKLYFRLSKVEHRESDDHKKMVAYLKPYCKICHIQLLSAMKFEIHKCTLNHLKAKLNKNEKTDDVDFDELNLGDFKTVDSIGDVDGEEVESDDDEELDSPEASPVGQEFVNKVEVNYCSLCREYLLRTAKDEKIISDHCKSKKHLKWYYQSKKKDENERTAKLKEDKKNELANSKESSSKKATSQESDKDSKNSDSAVTAATSLVKKEIAEKSSSQNDVLMKENDEENDADKSSDKFKRKKHYRYIVPAVHGSVGFAMNDTKGVFFVFSLVCLSLFFYGCFVTINSINNEKNECRMTFMFEHPNYVKINFEENDKFPHYNLWAYSEGYLTENVRNMIFNGAPVLFIPGNSGSFKQSRSLASVALRKGIDNDWFHHLDYFSVDLNEEYSALFGGVLEAQTLFIEHCIRAILKLYQRLPNPPKKIVIVGHSIGGKIAQKLLSSPDTAHLINTVIALASPMDKPVLNFDHYIENFYQSIDEYWSENRLVLDSLNNSCGITQRQNIEERKETRLLDDKLFITIGGGNRDLLVHPGLTDSKFSDLHVMSTGIPKVWVEADHLCIVWCLQLVLVVNRFLYSIIAPTKYKGPNSRGLSFIEDKSERLAKAEQHFLGLPTMKEENVLSRRMEMPENADWYEDNRKIFTEKFKTGINRTRIQMIRLLDNVLHHTVRVNAINQDTDDWIFGCEAVETSSKSRFCSQASALSKQFITKIPSLLPGRVHLHLNMNQLKKANPKWTHILLRFKPTREPFQYTVDIHNPPDRQLKVNMPKWYSFSSEIVLEDSLMGASHYQLNITGLDETHQALELIVSPKYCAKHRTVAKVCIPWTNGFDRFHEFENNGNLMIWTPKSRPINYNTTANPIVVELYLDPNCRYSFSIRQPLGQMLARIVQQFSHWFPAHLVAVICLSLKHQISLTPKGDKFKCGSFHKALQTCSPFFIITVTRLFFKFILMMRVLPKPETLPTGLTVSILIHGSSIALLTCFTAMIWAGITFCGGVAHKLLFKITKLPFPIISDTCLSIIEKFPASIAVLLISLAFASCGGIALVLACIVYFILLSKMYEDYLETFVFKTAKAIAMKLFGRAKRSKNSLDDENETKEEEKSSETSLVETTNEQKDDEPKDGEVEQEGDETDQMLDEAMAKQREERDKKEKELAAARVEYDSITEGLSEINFHLPIFFLLLVVTVLSLPSVVTWAKNYHYSRVLSTDPTLIPATCILIALAFIWQLPTPRGLIYYKIVGVLLYCAAVASVLYCQDAIFKLNFIIVGVFVLIAIHQLLSPKENTKNKDGPKDFFDELKSRYDNIFKGLVPK